MALFIQRHGQFVCAAYIQGGVHTYRVGRGGVQGGVGTARCIRTYTHVHPFPLPIHLTWGKLPSAPVPTMASQTVVEQLAAWAIKTICCRSE
jgi:hypothetical protein